MIFLATALQRYVSVVLFSCLYASLYSCFWGGQGQYVLQKGITVLTQGSSQDALYEHVWAERKQLACLEAFRFFAFPFCVNKHGLFYLKHPSVWLGFLRCSGLSLIIIDLFLDRFPRAAGTAPSCQSSSRVSTMLSDVEFEFWVMLYGATLRLGDPRWSHPFQLRTFYIL